MHYRHELQLEMELLKIPDMTHSMVSWLMMKTPIELYGEMYQKLITEKPQTERELVEMWYQRLKQIED